MKLVVMENSEIYPTVDVYEVDDDIFIDEEYINALGHNVGLSNWMTTNEDVTINLHSKCK